MVQQVKYEIIRTMGKVEIRHYQPIVLAEVVGENDRGFNILFRFINGNNRQRIKVEMTAPVISKTIEMTAPVLSTSDSIAFVMPSSFELENTPEPLDERVKIRQIPERKVAALRFSGRWTDSAFEKKSRELLEEMRKAEIAAIGSVFAMLYNSPFTPWFMRRNEVAVEVAEIRTPSP